MRKGHLDKIIISVKVQCNLPSTFTVSTSLVRKRTEQKSIIVMNKNGKGSISPLLRYEPEFIKLMIQMSRIHRALAPSGAIALINDCIAGTSAQTELVAWKRKHSIVGGIEDQIGLKYWSNFKKRNGDKIVTRRGQKFELDRAEWTTYRNFKSIYDSVGGEFEYAKVTVNLKVPE